MTVASVFGGVGVVFGGTLLGVFATGGFNEKQIAPETISFDYNPELFNTDYSQLEVTDSNGSGVFELILTTPTEEVTETKVKLSFNDSYPVTKAGGFISNTVIQVPEYVTIGQPFSAKMLTETLKLEDGSEVDWIKGGISHLHAESTDEVFADLQIAVDTPVYTTKTIVYDSNGEKVNPTIDGADSYYEILAGEKFTTESIFVPAKSEYMFGDDQIKDIDESQRRKKHSFFSVALLDSQANAVTPQYVDKNTVEFLASNKIQTDPVAINAFTFKYADSELTFNQENTTKEALEFYNTAITTLNGKGAAWKSSSAVMIGDAGIEEFSVQNTSISTIVRGENLNIYAVYNASQPKAQYLGASVMSNTGRYLDGMLANVGIRFTDASGNDVTVPGDDYLLEIDSNCKSVLYDGKTYYLPNSNVANIEKSYWGIHARSTGAEGDQNVTMEIVLFTGTESPVKKFETEDGVDTFTKTLRISDFAKDVYEWKGEIPTNYTLSYIGDECQKQVINLRDFIDTSSTEQIKFLVQFADTNGDPSDDYEINNMLGATSYYGKYTIDGISGTTYILKDSVVSLGDTGNFDVYFAVVNPNYNPEDKEYIKTLNIEKQTFTCKKALYGGSVIQANINLELVAPETEKYVYVGSADNSFTIDFIIAGDSKPAFEEKYKLNRNNFGVVLYDADGNDVTNYFSYTLNPELVLTEEFDDANGNGIKDPGEDYTGNYILTIEFTLKDNQQIKADNNTLQVARTTMSFEDATTEKITWGLVYDDGAEEMIPNEEFEFDTEKLYVYSPIATSITVGADAVDNTEATPIIVEQQLEPDGDFNLSITNPSFADEQALANAIAKEVEIEDQHGNKESLEGQWKFITDNANIVKVSGDGKSFTFGTANNEKAMIKIQSTDGKVAADNECWLVLTTKGVAEMQVDKNADGDFGDAGEGKTTDVTQAEVIISGNADEEIGNIKALLKYYLDGNVTYDPTLAVSLNSKTTSITDIQKTSLFGYVYNDTVNDSNTNGIIDNGEYSTPVDGWITMLDENNNKIYAICSSSGGSDTVVGFTGDITKIKSIKINNNFAKNETISFNITAKGISTTLDVEILPVASISGEETSYTLLAGKNYDGIDGKNLDPADPSDVLISNNVVIEAGATSTSTFLFDYYFQKFTSDNVLYVIYSDNSYVVSNVDDDGTSVARIVKVTTSGESYIIFNDFWDQDSKSITIEFAPDGNNYYAINKIMVFNVQRNVKISAYSNQGSSEQDFIDVSEVASMREFFNLYGNGNADDIKVETYFKVERIAGYSEPIPAGIFSYAVKEGGILAVDGVNFAKNGTSINFALQEYVEQEIYILCDINGTPTKFATTKIKVRPLENIYERIAANLLSKGSKSAKVQIINGQKYIVVDILTNENDEWTLTDPLNSFAKQSSTIIGRYPGGTVRTPLYSLNGGYYTFSNNLSALAGYTTDDKMIVQFAHEDYAGVKEYIYLNAIVSSVGNNPVVYETNGTYIKSQTGSDRIADYTSRYLEVAMMTPDKLIEKGIFDELVAGGSYDIFVNSGNGLYGEGTAVAYTGVGAENSAITNKLIKQLPSSSQNLVLYDLADNLGKDYYISFKYTIKNQDFYYVIKVKPNVRSLDPLYPFDGNFENLQENSGKIWLDETFNNTTLHNGDVRFNVVKLENSYEYTYGSRDNLFVRDAFTAGTIIKISYNGVDYFNEVKKKGNLGIQFESFKDEDGNTLDMTSGEKFVVTVVEGFATVDYNYQHEMVVHYTGLSFVDTIAQVTIDDSKILLSEAEWGKYITAKIVVEGGKSYLSYEAKDSKTPIKVVVRRTFVDSSYPNIEQIVDGSIDYVFAINDQSKDYSIRFEKEVTGSTEVEVLPDNFGNNEYEITFRNGSTFQGLNNTYHRYTGLKVYLVENAVVGDTTSGTVVKDIVRVQESQDDNNIIQLVDYINTGSDNGSLTVKFAEYIPQDSVATLTVFTSYGHIATIKFNVLANAEIEFNKTELEGGQTYSLEASAAQGALVKLFNKNGHTVGDDFEITNITVKENGTTKSGLMEISDDREITISDLTRDRSVDVEFKVRFADGKTFTFTKTFKLKANVVAGKAQKYEKEIIAGSSFTIGQTGADFDIDTLFEVKDSTPVTYRSPTEISSISVQTTNGAFDTDPTKSKWDNTNKNYIIQTNYISTTTVVSTELIVTLNSGETINLGFSFTVVPAVQFETNYPNPTGEANGELEMEYVDGGTTTDVKINGVQSKGFKTTLIAAFLLHEDKKATFAEKHRVVIKNAGQVGNSVRYIDELQYGNIDKNLLKITLVSSVNAFVYISASSPNYNITTDPLSDNTELVYNKYIYLVRGSKTNEHSIVKFLVEYKGVSQEYVIYISNQLWSAQENYVTTNKVAGQYPEALSWSNVLSSSNNHTNCTSATCIGLTEAQKYNETTNPNGYTTKYIFDIPENIRPQLELGDVIILEVEQATDTWASTTGTTNPNNFSVAHSSGDVKLLSNKNGKRTYQFSRTDTSNNTFWIYDGNEGDKFTFTRVQNNVTAEKIYVDKTNVNNMLADDRMATVTIAGSAQEGEYYLAYKERATETYVYDSLNTVYHLGTTDLQAGAVIDITMTGKIKFTYNGVEYENTSIGTKTISIDYVKDVNTITVISADSGATIDFGYNSVYYISNSFYVRKEDLGKTLTLDLGISMTDPTTDRTFYGVFKVEDLKNAGIGYLSYTASPARQITYSTDSPALDVLEKQGVFSSVPILGNRVQLYYGEPLASYPVASNKYEFASEFHCNNGASQTLDAVYQQQLTLRVDINGDTVVETDGKEDVITNYLYYYMPAIDIELTNTQALAGAGSSIVVEANKEYKSVSELFGLIHPSTGQHLSPADGDTVTITLETINDAAAQSLPFYNSYLTATGFDGFKKVTDSGRIYLYIEDVQYNDNTYDFGITPQGADADGDYSLLKITYTVGGFEKIYYVVVNIAPDYDIKFGKEGGQVDSQGIISNKNAPYIISANEDATTYNDVTLAGAGGYLSITHKNTESKEEIALSGFKVHLPVKDDASDENAKTNVKNKISITLGNNKFELGGVVISGSTALSAGDRLNYNYSADTDNKIIMSGVPVTVFTAQTFYIEGEDDFGYKYQLYFTLSSKGNQPKAITEGIVVNETKAIDFGLQYQLLNVSVNESSGEAAISSTSMAPVSTADIPVINISGIKAWLFNKAAGAENQAISISGTQIMVDKDGNTTTPADQKSYTVIEESRNYLAQADFTKVIVENVEIYTADGNTMIKELDFQSGKSKTLATSSDAKYYDGTTLEGARSVDGTWVIPRIDGSYYGSANKAKFILRITLKYDAGGSAVEFCTVPVTVEIGRGLDITPSDNSLAIDGEEIDVASQFVIKDGTTDKTATFINDTLEFVVKPNSVAKFTISAEREVSGSSGVWEELGTVGIINESNTGVSAYTTKYVSISQYIGTNIKAGDKIAISDVSNIEKFYYITKAKIGAGSNEDSQTTSRWTADAGGATFSFNAGEIEKDYIYIENQSLLQATLYKNVTKYYIAQVNLASDDYYYRVARDYTVTGSYYSFKPGYTGSIGQTIGSITGGDFATWSNISALSGDKAFVVEKADNAISGKITGVSDTTDELLNNLEFEIDQKASSSYGKASIQLVDTNPNLRINGTLKNDEYVSVVVYMKVSGPDRNKATSVGEESISRIKLGVVRLALHSTPSQAIQANRVKTPLNLAANGNVALTARTNKAIAGYCVQVNAVYLVEKLEKIDLGEGYTSGEKITISSSADVELTYGTTKINLGTANGRSAEITYDVNKGLYLYFNSTDGNMLTFSVGGVQKNQTVLSVFNYGVCHGGGTGGPMLYKGEIYHFNFYILDFTPNFSDKEIFIDTESAALNNSYRKCLDALGWYLDLD